MNKVNITNICDIQVGKTPSRSNPTYWGDGSLWLSIADMNQGTYLERTKETITEKAIKECNCKIVPQDTVLFSFKLSIGKVGITKVPMYTNEAIAAFKIKDKSKLKTKYLLYYLKSGDFTVGSNKAVMGKTLNKEQLKRIAIPIYSINEQERIINNLDQADILRQKRKKAIDLLDEYLKSVFLEMFGDSVTNTKGWSTSTFIKVCTKICGGGTPSKSKPEYYTGSIPWVSPKDMKSRYINDSEDHITPEAIENSSTKLIPINSVLMVIRSGILKNKLPVAINTVEVTVNQDMKAFVVDQNIANPYFVLFLLELSQRSLLNKVRSVTADNLNFDDVKNFPVILPPVEEQNKFAQIAQNIEVLKQKMLEQSNELDNQFNALMQKSFNTN